MSRLNVSAIDNTGKNKNAPSKYFSWIIFILLSLVWGSSFILMKGGLLSLTPIQVASLRIIFAAIVLIPWTIKALKVVPLKRVGIIFLSGLLGSLLPAYLFCIAEQKIDSGVAGTLNALTPVFVVLTGVLLFNMPISLRKLTGVIIAFIGSILLLISHGTIDYSSNISYGLLIFLATICYGTNANLVHKYLKDISSLNITCVALTICALPALGMLLGGNFIHLHWSDNSIRESLLYTAILGVVGTAIATVLYYMLVKRSGAVFSSMVTYCIPVVANIWGLLFGEHIGIMQFLCLLIILSGVYYANMNFNWKFNSFKTSKTAE